MLALPSQPPEGLSPPLTNTQELHLWSELDAPLRIHDEEEEGEMDIGTEEVVR